MKGGKNVEEKYQGKGKIVTGGWDQWKAKAL